MSGIPLIIAMILVVADLVFCLAAGFKMKDSASKSTEDYFLGGKKANSFLLLCTCWASISGAGVFQGQAGRGAIYGISAYWQYFGENLVAGLLLGMIIAPFLARYKYITMAQYISEEMAGGNKLVRRLGGLATLMPNICWPGSQIMGVALVLQAMLGIDFRVCAIVVGIVFIIYTYMGGVEAVLLTDALHGIVSFIFIVAIAFYGFKMINFDISGTIQALAEQFPAKMVLVTDKPVVHLSSFLVGLVGGMSNPLVWNRAFMAKDEKTGKRGMGVAFWTNIILIPCLIFLGLAVNLFAPDVGDGALTWLVMNKCPAWVQIVMAWAILAACVSAADTHINCAAANIVTDIIDPDDKMDEKRRMKIAKTSTVICGLIALFAALYADQIYALGNVGYSVCGGVLIPIFAVGLLFKDRKSKTFRSRMSGKAIAVAAVVGIVVVIPFELIPSLYSIFGGGVIPAIVSTVATMLIANCFFKDQTWNTSVEAAK